MIEQILKSKVQDMNEKQTICWHYVMDIHEPEEYWYSVHIMEK